MITHVLAEKAYSPVLSVSNIGFQSSDPSDLHLLTVFAGIAAISLLVLVLLVLGALIALVLIALRTKAAALRTAAEVKIKVYPIIDKANGLVGTLSPTIQSITEKTNALIGDLTPKISDITENVRGIAGNVENMSRIANEKFEEFSPTLSAIHQTVTSTNDMARDASHKTQQQVERVDSIVTSVLDKAVEFPSALSGAVQARFTSARHWARALKMWPLSPFTKAKTGK